MKPSSTALTLLAVLVAAVAGLGATGTFSGTNTQAGTEIQCIVRSIHDGDSMRMQCPGDRPNGVAVRMRQIDAPELEQAHGRRAHDHLRRLCPVGSAATIRTDGLDQYGRLLGDVYCGGKSVNQEMVASGSAWIYDRYVQDRDLYTLQDQARARKNGLWAQGNPQPPWRWRHQQRAND